MFYWMLMPFRRYASFSGRSRRKEYWLYTPFYVLATSIFVALMFAGIPWSEVSDGAASSQLKSEETTLGPLMWLGLAWAGIFTLATIIPNIAVTVRRLHDQNLSGWLYLLSLIPYIGALAIFVLMCIDGTRGPNRFGDDPKDANAALIFE